MGNREELEAFKDRLIGASKSNDIQSVLESLKIFQERFEELLTEKDVDDIKKMITEIKRSHTPIPTNHEFLLFLILSIFMIGLFGEPHRKITDRTDTFLLIFVFFICFLHFCYLQHSSDTSCTSH